MQAENKDPVGADVATRAKLVTQKPERPGGWRTHPDSYVWTDGAFFYRSHVGTSADLSSGITLGHDARL